MYLSANACGSMRMRVNDNVLHWLLIAGKCGNGLCYYSTVPRCCPNIKGLECNKSVSTLLIEGRRIEVTHHRIACKSKF